MRTALIAALVMVGCGGDDGGGAPTPLPKCATPVSGQTMSEKKIAQVSGAALVVASPKETVPGSFPGGISSIHADARGELYITDVSGNVYHLEAGA
ncbi:MAG TPA: hypothetical protein VGM39_02255 [Kofleriaceae bacterium]|jgi:hypothetical protein